MILKINEQMLNEYGYNFKNADDLYFFIENCIYYLAHHNKNYTKEQYSKIDTLADLISFVELQGEENDE